MFRIHFTPADLVRTRIARDPDPMWEVVLSLHVLRTRGGEVHLGPWRRHAVRSVPHAHIWRLLELSPPLGYFPDFLTPPGGDQTLDEELDLALSTPRTQLSGEIRYLASPGRFRTGVRLTRWLRAVERGDAGTMAELEASVRTFHRAGLAPFWGGIQAAVSSDRAARAEQYAIGGLDRLLSTLHPRVRWRPPVLEVLDLYAPTSTSTAAACCSSRRTSARKRRPARDSAAGADLPDHQADHRAGPGGPERGAPRRRTARAHPCGRPCGHHERVYDQRPRPSLRHRDLDRQPTGHRPP